MVDVTNRRFTRTAEEEMKNFMIRTQWHKIFDYAPSLIKLISENDSRIFFESFLKWAKENNLSMGWTMHFHLLNWISSQSKWYGVIDENIIKELLAATTIRWALGGFDHIAAKGMIITSDKLQGVAVGVWKSFIVGKSNHVIIANIKDSQPPQDCYAVSYENNSWKNIIWKNIPL